jgi:maleylacetoacetate isomerase
MKVYHYFRSSASYRVRIALNLKNIPHELVQIHLIKEGGEQLQEAYRAINPDGLVPALVEGEGDAQHILSQSLAIMEYLDETHPGPALLPANALDRAYVRAIALQIACDIHPLNNLRVLRFLTNDLKVTEEDKNVWYRHWCEQGLGALEKTLASDKRVGKFCYGDTPGLADCCLVPQVYNALRFKSDLSGMPTILRINEACLALPEFASAVPEAQADAE